MNISLRPAEHEDYEFLWWLHCSTIRPYVELTWGWDEAWQRQYFRERFDPDRREIVECDGSPIGCISVEWSDDHGFLSLIEIAPEYQSQGIGTRLIERCLADAERRRLPVRLRVLRANSPARRLYERLGFVMVRETDERIHMEWLPEADPGGAAD
jgi:ribosomal protein S18 acetylase RimI-like enzyme